MGLPQVRLTVRRAAATATTILLVVVAVVDLALNDRRAVRFRAAWAYDVQHRDCTRLAQAYARQAGKEQREADRWPDGSSRRASCLRVASFYTSMGAHAAGVAATARKRARELRRLARRPS